jgi:hypothetical protein
MSLRGKGTSRLLMVGVGVEVGCSDIVVAGEVDCTVEDSAGVERIISPAQPERREAHRTAASEKQADAL